MSDTAKIPRVERTAAQKAEERRIRELHERTPVVAIPDETVRGEDVAQMLRFVSQLTREREAQGLTVEQVAQRAGLGVEALIQLEAGQAFNPTISTLFRIARALGKKLMLGFEQTS